MILKLSPKYQFSSPRHLHAKSVPLKITSEILERFCRPSQVSDILREFTEPGATSSGSRRAQPKHLECREKAATKQKWSIPGIGQAAHQGYGS
jgi:hypothetical protein